MKDEIALRLIRQLVRRELLDEEDIADICDGLDEESAHEVNCAFLDMLPMSEAEIRRADMRAIDGGKSD